MPEQHSMSPRRNSTLSHEQLSKLVAEAANSDAVRELRELLPPNDNLPLKRDTRFKSDTLLQ